MKQRVAILSLLVMVLGCADNPALPRNDTGGEGQIAVLNAFRAGDIATLSLDGTNLQLPASGESGTAVLSSGTHQLQARSGSQVATANFTVADGTHRTAVVSGFSEHAVLVVTTIDTAAVPTPDATKLRVVHTVATEPALDAYVVPVTPGYPDEPPFAAGLTYGSGTDPRLPGYAVRPGGTYIVRLTLAGTGTVVAVTPAVTLPNGGVTSFVLTQGITGALEIRTVREQ
jgi:hypothetical protein